MPVLPRLYNFVEHGRNGEIVPGEWDVEEIENPYPYVLEPWKDRGVPNLEKYHMGLQKSLVALRAGDFMPITFAAASYAGLSKDLDFDRRWMTEENQKAVQKAVVDVVSLAHQIQRIGYDLSQKDLR